MRNMHLPEWDWRIWGGSLVTLIWLAGGTAYVGTVVGWAFWQQDTATIGGFFTLRLRAEEPLQILNI